MRVLVVEDDPNIRAPLATNLRETGFVVEEADRASSAETLALGRNFDALLMDVGLPEGERAGFALVKRLREQGVTTPVLFLTARDAIEDRVAGVVSGGDDYLVKPFHLHEVRSRLRGLHRPLEPVGQGVLSWKGLKLDFGQRSVQLEGQPVRLSTKEYAILALLAADPGRGFSREEIASSAFPGEQQVSPDVLEAYIANVRRKIGDWVLERVGDAYRLPMPPSATA